MTSPSRRRVLFLGSGLVLFWLAPACSREATAPLSRTSSDAASARAASTGIDVTSVLPDTGRLGATMDVRVRGKGFDPEAVVTFALDGVVDPNQVRTNSTRYVSSSELVVNISISNAATSAAWDVTVKGKTGIGTESDIFKVLDPSATWAFPQGDASLAIQSDGLFVEGGFSVYADRVCRVETAIYATSQSSPSGDATIKTSVPKGSGCGRRLTFTYPDGVSENLAIFANLVGLETNTSSIPVGTTVLRKLNFNPGAIVGQTSRCGRLIFGPREAVAVGSDSVQVTRVDESTWDVQSQGQHLGYCEANAQLYRMPLRFRVVSSTTLR